MYKNKKILAIIPARSGSKGIKDKNIRNLKGKPLISYTINSAKESGVFTEIIVSTDSLKYAEISEYYGANVPFLRPIELSRDESLTEDLIIYTLAELEKLGRVYDYFVLLQPTSPFRDGIDIKNVVKMMVEDDLNSVISVCEVEHNPLLSNKLDSDLSMKDFISLENNKRRQDLKKIYRLNGAIYAANVNEYIESRNLYGDKSRAYIMDNIKSIDIDDEIDFKFAEFILNEENSK